MQVVIAFGLACVHAGVAAGAPGLLSVAIEGLKPNGDLPLSSAFCLPGGTAAKPLDRNPGVHWSAGPAGTRSYALLMVDPDVTADLSLMNKPGVTIPVDAPRMDIYHWVLVDIPSAVHAIPAGAEGDGFVQGGKPIGPTQLGLRGTNDYWPYFNKNPKAPAAMKGPYGGYDGPCPPGNDLLDHRYRFEVFAIDVASLGLSGQFLAPAVLVAMRGHVLASGSATARFAFDRSASNRGVAGTGLAGIEGGLARDPK